MPKVYVGSLNKVKVEAVNVVLNGFDLIPVNTDSKVSSQPFNDEETIEGAFNRASGLPKDGLRIGLEAGVHVIKDIMYLVNWGVLIDEDENIYYAGGTRIPLPNDVKEKLETTNEELATIMDKYYHTVDIKHNEGAIGLFTNGLIKRVDIFTHIVKLLYGQYLYKRGVSI